MYGQKNPSDPNYTYSGFVYYGTTDGWHSYTFTPTKSQLMIQFRQGSNGQGLYYYLEAVELLYKDGTIHYTLEQDTAHYQFGFNGAEKDNEVSGEGNAYDYGDREYDPRSIRWWKVDRLVRSYPSIAPYVFAGNSTLIFKDLDGEKFVNPYAEQYKKAKLELEKSTEVYNSLITNHVGKVTGAVKKEYKKQSGLTHWQNEYNKYQPDYQEVEDYLYTLYVSNNEEYKYFETLKDAKGKEINIVVVLFDANSEATDAGNTLGLAKYEGTYIPTAVLDARTGLPTITIALYQKSDAAFEYNNGRNYMTFANELGDIKYFFDNVKDQLSYEKWENSADSKSAGYRNDPTGAGAFSREYENRRVDDVKTYSRKLGESESYNNIKSTIEKRESEQK